MTPLTRTLDPDVMGGKPCIRGMRITVGTIVGLVASGRTIPEILAAYPYLEEEDIREAFSYAAWPRRRDGSPAWEVIKLLVDISLSPAWVDVFIKHRWSAVRWLEDYLELQDPRVKARIRKVTAEFRAGKSRPVEEFLAELKSEAKSARKTRRQKA